MMPPARGTGHISAKPRGAPEGRHARSGHRRPCGRPAGGQRCLGPLRSQLSRVPFLGGSAPNYADYIALGAFQWVASVSTLPLLARSDEVLRVLARPRIRPLRWIGPRPEHPAAVRLGPVHACPTAALCRFGRPSSVRGAVRRALAPGRVDANCR